MATRTRKRLTPAQIEKRIVPISRADPYVKLMVYGRNGTGKTRFAASAPDVLLIDINEKGTKSARHIKGPKVYRVSHWEDMADIFWYLKAGEHPYKSVAIDTLTQMQSLCMRFVLREEADRDPTKDPSMPGRREWGKMGELMKPLLMSYRNLPMHVIFTAQERTFGDDDEGGIVEHVPDMSPGPRGAAMGAVDVIGRLYQSEVKTKGAKGRSSKWETRMLVGPHAAYVTKDRTGNLGRIVRNPNVPDIIHASNGVEE